MNHIKLIMITTKTFLLVDVLFQHSFAGSIIIRMIPILTALFK